MLDSFLKRRWWWATTLLVAVATTTLGLPHAMVPDNAMTVWFMEDDPALQRYRNFHERFGNDEVVLLEVQDDKGVLREHNLPVLQSLADALASVDGIARVHSLLTTQQAMDTAEGVSFGLPLPDPAPRGAALTELSESLRGSELFADRLLSRDGKRAVFWAELAVLPDIDARRDVIVADLRAAAAEVLADRDHHMAGFGVIYAGINQLTKRDFAVFLGACYLLMLLVLQWIFRSVRLVAVTLGVMILGSTGALGMLGLAGYRLNMVTSVLPTVILVLGIADAVHFPAAFTQVLRERPQASRGEVVAESLRRVVPPCLLTTLTTVAGFMSLAASPMSVMVQLGIFTSIGMVIALLASVTLMTLAFFSLKQAPPIPDHDLVDRLLGWTRRLLANHPAALAGICVAVCAVAGAGALRVEADTFSLGYLPEDSQVVRDHRAIEAGWGDYSPLDYTLLPLNGRSLDEPELVVALEAFVREACQLPEVRNGFSVHSFYRSMAQAFGSELTPNTPLDTELVAQLGLLLDSQARDLEWREGEPAYTDNFLAPVRSEDADQARLTLIVKMASAREFEDLLQRLEPIAERHLGKLVRMETSGYLPLYISVIDHVIASQTRSFLLALGIIFLMMWAFTRSLELATMSLVPNVFPVLVMMGVMGWLGIDLDITTATVAAIVLGVSIDDTVHFMHHWRGCERRGLDWSSSVQTVFQRAGRPALVTTLLLLAGYPVLMLASVQPVVHFGLLTTCAAAAALFADLTLLPLLLRGRHARRVSACAAPRPSATPLAQRLAPGMPSIHGEAGVE